MRNVHVASITIENFKSFVNATTIHFTETVGLIFFGGVNEVEPRLGANGAGKSSLWDALIWLLYGKTARGNLASEITSWGQSRPRVQALFRIDGQFFWLERWGSPNKLYTKDDQNEKPYAIDQRDVEVTIGLTYKRFLQSVIFGQMVPLFLDLTIPQRGELLDEVMDLGLWLRASERASKSMAEFQSAARKASNQADVLAGEVRGLESEDAIQKQIDEWEEQRHKLIEIELAKIEALEKELDVSLENKKLAEQETAGDSRAISECETRISELTEKIETASKKQYKWRAERVELDVQKAFFAKHLSHSGASCPQCGQIMTEQMLRSSIAKIQEKIKEAEKEETRYLAQRDSLRKALAGVTSRLETLRRQDRDIETRISMLSLRISAQERAIEEAIARVEQQHASHANPHAKRLQAVLQRRAALAAQIDELRAEAAVAAANAARSDYWRTAFKRVRLFLVARVLTTFEVETANAASVLGLPGWQIKYATEVETKSGSMKAGIQVLVQSPLASAPWEVWSGGEGQRIKLAVSLGMAAMIQRSAGVNFTWEVYDEPAAWLSSEGIDDLLECLDYRAQITKKAVWIIDPRGFNYGGFIEQWQAIKTVTGTCIRRIGATVS